MMRKSLGLWTSAHNGGSCKCIISQNQYFISSPRAYLTGVQALDTVKARVFEMKAILSVNKLIIIVITKTLYLLHVCFQRIL